jgi:threonine/homoserine/homoserine lactone efflux protein
MLILAGVFATSFVIALSGAMMPGPLFAATITASAKRGIIAGPALILGHAILELAMVAAILFGLAPLLTRDMVFACIALFGAAVLLWMSFSMIKSLPKTNVDWEAHDSSNAENLVFQGIVMSMSNPYWTIWWATIGLGYILYCRTLGLPGLAVFFAGHIMGDLSWYSLVSVIVAKGRHLLTIKVYRGLIGGCAVFISCFALYFIYSGISRLAG